MTHSPYIFSPCTENSETALQLRRLLVPGPLVDDDLLKRISSLQKRFAIYASTVPFGLWAPGLQVTDEQRLLTEVYLPLHEIRSAFARLTIISLNFSASGYASALSMHYNWLDILPLLPSSVAHPNPAAILLLLMKNEEERCRFFFSIFLPKSYGGGFGRYKKQALFLRSWLQEKHKQGKRKMRCLDAACGSGEGTYELAQILLDEDFSPELFIVDGVSLHPFEIFSASHCYFPHDPSRQQMFRRETAALFAAGGAGSVRFIQEDLRCSPMQGKYDVILCNGLLGGPLLHDEHLLQMVIQLLAGRLAVGGILLASDRFHAGWKQTVPKGMIERMIHLKGLQTIPVPEGIAAIGPAAEERSLDE